MKNVIYLGVCLILIIQNAESAVLPASETEKYTYYFIKSDLNGLVLDVGQNLRLPGAPVSLYENINKDNQKWRFETGTIRSKLNGFCLDIEGYLSDDILVVNPCQEGKINQQLEQKGKAIANSIEKNMVLDIADANPQPGARVRVYYENFTPAQSWTFEVVTVVEELPYYFIKSDMNGLVLDAENGHKLPGTPVAPYYENGADSQKWRFETGTIRSKITGFCLDIEVDRLVMNPCQEGKINQQWEQKDKTIANSIQTDMVLDIFNSDPNPRARVQVWELTGNNNQWWTFELVP